MLVMKKEMQRQAHTLVQNQVGKYQSDHFLKVEEKDSGNLCLQSSRETKCACVYGPIKMTPIHVFLPPPFLSLAALGN
jgi:hypothetical protein